MPFHVIINPGLTLEPGATAEFFEGCLSVDGWMALVPRAAAVRVEALDDQGRDVRITARGWHARILQHEIDHLHGTLCIDRMDSAHAVEPRQLRQHWRGQSVAEVRAALQAPSRSLRADVDFRRCIRSASGCAAPCCVGRDVPVGDDEVAALGVDARRAGHAFAIDGEGRARACGGSDGDDACVFAVAAGGSYRCGVEARPSRARAASIRIMSPSTRRARGPRRTATTRPARCRATRRGRRGCPRSAPTIDAAVRAHEDEPRRLPVVGDSPCFGCTTTVLSRLRRAGERPRRVAPGARARACRGARSSSVRPTPADYMESFTLDSSGQKRRFSCAGARGGACALLTSLPDGSHRCGVHAVRPLACRLYPYRGDWVPGAPIRVVADAVCPPPQRDRYEARKVFAASDVVAEVGERHFYMRALERWDEAARTRPPAQAYRVDDFLRWAFALYDAVEELRRKGPIGFSAASALMATFPLPDESAPGC